MPFPNQINLTQPPIKAGDFASDNPRQFAIPPMGNGFFSGPAGVTVGLFVWADSATLSQLSNTATGSFTTLPIGIMPNILQGLYTTYLAESGMLIPAGLAVNAPIMNGDIAVKNAGAGAVTFGMKAFANSTTGTVSFAAPGATVAGSVETKWYAWTPGVSNDPIIVSTALPG